MVQYSKTLIVEGNADRQFFVSLFIQMGLRDVGVEPKLNVTVHTPKDWGGHADTKNAALSVLSTALKDLKDGKKTHLALVLDADATGIKGGGWQATLQDVVERIASYGYVAPPTGSLAEGFIFENEQPAIQPFGLWIMADGSGEGAFEEWFIPALQQHDAAMYEYVRASVGGIPEKRFRDVDRGKAEITTWRAWQRQVGYFDLEKINLNVPPMQPLIQWLNRIYQ